MSALAGGWFSARRYVGDAGAASARVMSFRDRTVVITGASRGLGRGCAEAFAALGAHVVLVARKAKELDEAVATIRSSGGSVHGVVCDVTHVNDVVALFDG